MDDHLASSPLPATWFIKNGVAHRRQSRGNYGLWTTECGEPIENGLLVWSADGPALPIAQSTSAVSSRKWRQLARMTPQPSPVIPNSIDSTSLRRRSGAHELSIVATLEKAGPRTVGTS